MRSIAFLVFALFFALVYSCASEDPVSDDQPDKTDSLPDTTTDTLVSYSNEILPMLKRRNCTGCHSMNDASGNVVLDPFDSLSNYVQNGLFLKVIQHEADVTPMPYQRPKMPENEIELIKRWISEGYEED